MRKTMLILLILSVLASSQAAYGLGTVQKAFAGYALKLCNLVSCRLDQVATGVAADINVAQATIDAGETIAYWVSLDGSDPVVGSHEWIQAGYVLGQQQDGSFSAWPVMYVESCWAPACAPGAGYFLGIIGIAGFNTWHNFNVSLVQTGSGIRTFLSIDGVVRYSNFLTFTAGMASASLEAFQSSVPANAHWTNLKFSDTSGTWHNWGDSPGFLQTTHSVVEENSCVFGVSPVSNTEFFATGVDCGRNPFDHSK